ncbi:MAG: ABC transporter ATP-binding protein [Zoogloea sp.]|nr:ABC transporter ATP-binding protein [Zoogloea sp.]
MSTPLPSLQARGISHAYRGKVVLRGASLGFGPGEVVSLLGANGAGKSTFLRLMLGLMRPDAGELLLHGRPLAGYSRRALAQAVAYVPQVHVTPFPYKLRDVVMLGRLPHTGLARAPGQADHLAVDAVLERLGISHLAERPYTEVSGGERQLALIARALAQGARLLVMDEPTSGLDYGNQLRLLDHLLTLAADGYGVLKTTHHPEHVLLGSHRVAILQDGRITADGPPAEVLTRRLLNKLYGVDVEPVRLPDGRLTFMPAAKPGPVDGAERSGFPDTAPAARPAVPA